jgi:lysosomal alpha-mannosidase
MTFEPWKDGTFLIRFEHLLEKGEDPELSKPVRFNLTDVFPGMEMELREVILSANQWIEDSQRLHFRAESMDFSKEFKDGDLKLIEDNEVTLEPMQIRTFILTMWQHV